jgi:hypothetical protein
MHLCAYFLCGDRFLRDLDYLIAELLDKIVKISSVSLGTVKMYSKVAVPF